MMTTKFNAIEVAVQENMAHAVLSDTKKQHVKRAEVSK